MSVPVQLNEPTSALQRISACMEYNQLLDKAAEETDSLRRLALIATHGVSCWTNIEYGTSKPFNPLLGETYELQTDDFKLLAE
jgi:hypothetical protein